MDSKLNNFSDFYTFTPDSFNEILALFSRSGYVLRSDVDLSVLSSVVCSRRWDSLSSACSFILRFLVNRGV